MAASAREGNAAEGEYMHRPLTLAEKKELLALVMRPSWPWILAMAVVAVASAVRIQHPSSGGVTVDEGVSTVTLTAIALIWLPAVVRLLSMTGFALKGFGLEASSGGIANVDELIVGLAAIKTKVTEVERSVPAAAGQASHLQEAVDQIASEVLVGRATVTADAMGALARRYEKTRARGGPSVDRTIQMNTILNEARVRASSAPQLARQLALGLLESDADGDRVIALALLQQAPTPDAIDGILRVLASSRSAFEQYHALVAIRAVASSLSAKQKAAAIAALEHERTDPRDVGLNRDRYIPSEFTRALSALGFEERR